MDVVLEPVSLGEANPIEVRFFLSRCRRTGRKFLIIKYCGNCRTGDHGEADGRYMLAMGRAGITAWEPDGLIVELIDFECPALVDGLRSLLSLGEGEFGIENMPQAVVTGPRCEQAIRAFFVNDGTGSGIEAAKQCSRDIASAMDRVGEGIAKLDSLFGRKTQWPESP
jgi:hypothetical protein